MGDATQGGVDKHIRLAMQPTRPSLADAVGIMDLLNDPAAEKLGGQSSRRQVIKPEPEHGLVATMGPTGLFYANTVGAFGAVSPGQNWDRLSSAAHRWSLKVVEAKELFISLFSDGALSLSRNGVFEESFLVITSP